MSSSAWAMCLAVAAMFTAGCHRGPCVGDDDCSDGVFCNGRERCDARAEGADARGCAPPRGRACLAVHVCDEDHDFCEDGCGELLSDGGVRFVVDVDGDGVARLACGGTDCDDSDPQRSPGRIEVCDGMRHDEDCDFTTYGETDGDGDGYVSASCCNQSATQSYCGPDCNDTNPHVHPGLLEICDGLDNDCDGTVDTNVTVPLYLDPDRDGFGAGNPIQGCFPGSGGGVSLLSGDCDQANPAIGPGDMRCKGLEYEQCVDGGWTPAATCGGNASCRPQPNGTGVCI